MPSTSDSRAARQVQQASASGVGVSSAVTALIGTVLPHLTAAGSNVSGSSTSSRQAQRALTQAEELAYDVLGSQLASRQSSEPGVVEERLRRTVQRQGRVAGAATDPSVNALQISNLVSRLQSHKIPAQQLGGYLTLLEQLAYASNTAGQGSRPIPTLGRPPQLAQRSSSAAALHEERAPGAHAETKVSSRRPRAEVLTEWKRAQGQPEVPEIELLRDLIFLLQGISGKYLHFEEVSLQQVQEEQRKAQVKAQLANKAARSDDAPLHEQSILDLGDDIEGNNMLRIRFREGKGMHIPQPTRHLIHRVAELGRLYRRISTFATRTLAAVEPTQANWIGNRGGHRSTSSSKPIGLIMQSLIHVTEAELTEYYRLIVILESQLQIRIDADGRPHSSAADEDGSGLTLKRISAWTDDFLLRMRMMSAVIESCKDSHGGALVSVIHTYTFNGDPFIRKFTARLLEEVSKPFLQTLSCWIHEGELQDPYQEFFVQLNSEPAAGGGPADITGKEAQPDADAALLWQNKFSFREEMLPSFLGESFGRKIFATGKSLNFIRHSCGGGDWIATRHQLGGVGSQGLRYTDIAGLEATINSAYSIVSQRLLAIFLEKYNLMGHLTALKEYLMLSKGDFVDLLMESIGPSLNRQASSLFRHNLTASLETAVRGSNAQFDDADIIRRLDARVLDFSAGDTGWDTFTLDYKVDSPVNTVLDARAMSGYQAVFNHLWKIKRVELVLSTSWSRLCAAKAGHRRAFGRKLEGAQRETDKSMMQALQRLGEMTHFIRQLQAYNQLEVIEYSWHDLQAFFSKRQGDLDELIEAHRAFLDALVGKMMLKGGRRSATTALVDEVRANLDTMLAFCSAIDDLAHHVNGELAQAQVGDQRPVAAARGGPERVTLPSIMSRVRQHSTTFQDRTQGIIVALEKHANLVVRDLGSRLNFNAYYERKDKDRTVPSRDRE